MSLKVLMSKDELTTLFLLSSFIGGGPEKTLRGVFSCGNQGLNNKICGIVSKCHLFGNYSNILSGNIHFYK